MLIDSIVPLIVPVWCRFMQEGVYFYLSSATKAGFGMTIYFWRKRNGRNGNGIFCLWLTVDVSFPHHLLQALHTQTSYFHNTSNSHPKNLICFLTKNLIYNLFIFLFVSFLYWFFFLFLLQESTQQWRQQNLSDKKIQQQWQHFTSRGRRRPILTWSAVAMAAERKHKRKYDQTRRLLLMLNL